MTDVAIRGPIGTRTFHLQKKCETSEGHQHNYDHVTLIIRGRLKVTYSYIRDGQKVEGESREFGPGDDVIIKAEVFHTLKAMEDDTVYRCIYSHRDFNGVVVEKYNSAACTPKAYI